MVRESAMATMSEPEARMHAPRTNGEHAPPRKWWELAQLLAELKIQVPSACSGDLFGHAVPSL